jgi:hypothetical protein
VRARTLDKEPPNVRTIFELLCALDDIISFDDVARLSTIPKASCRTALYMLVAYKAVERIDQEDGTVWFMATPQSDTRVKSVLLRKPETQPRRPKKGKTKKLPTLNLVTGEETPA